MPSHDKWFDPFAKRLGQKVGVNVTVDHIDQAQITTRIAAEIQAGQGHDLIQYIAPLSQFEPSVLDLKDVTDEANKRWGDAARAVPEVQLQPDHRQVLRVLAGLGARPGQLPQVAVGAGRLPQRPDHLGRPAPGRRRDQEVARASRWAWACPRRSTPTWSCAR